MNVKANFSITAENKTSKNVGTISKREIILIFLVI